MGGLPPSHRKDTAAHACFDCSGLRVQAGERTLLSIEKLSFPAACVTGLIGHNGSGKSTLLKLLAGQVQAAAGRVEFEGKPLAQWDRRALARSVAYLPQDPPATRGMLVRELVALGRYPWHGAFGRFSEADGEKTEAAMKLTGTVHLADRLVDTLSGGERQRAWIAMMVAQDARCLLLDEPISALDVAHQIEILDLVRGLSETRKLSAVIVLHDINMAARYCDRLVALKHGACVAEGAPAALLQAPVLKDLFGVSMNVMPHPAGHGVLAYVD